MGERGTDCAREGKTFIANLPATQHIPINHKKHFNFFFSLSAFLLFFSAGYINAPTHTKQIGGAGTGAGLVMGASGM